MSNYVSSSIGTPGIGLRNVSNGNPTIDTVFLEVFCVVFGFFVLACIYGSQWQALKKRKLKSLEFKKTQEPIYTMEKIKYSQRENKRD